MKTRILSVATFMVALISFSFAGPAQVAHAETFTLSLKPGQQAEVSFSFWCMDYGKPFPTAIETVGERAPESVIAVVRAAMAKGVTASDPYQTQVAVWRDIEGEFKDFANAGTVLAQEIYSASLQTAVPPLPAGEPTLAEMIAQGAVSITVEGLTLTLPATPTITPEQAFNGTGAVIIRNISDKTVRFVVPEGVVFIPSGGVNAQRLVAELRGRPELPQTGSLNPEFPMDSLAMIAAGAALFSAGIALAVAPTLRARRKP
jgi:hypothetical protein